MNASQRTRDRQKRLRAERIEIDGRLVHPDAPHGNGSTNGYVNYGCRCASCSADWAAWTAARRHERARDGRMVDGRWVVTNAPHNTEGGYGNYGCRCTPCTDAWTEATLDRRARRHAEASA